MSAETCRAIDSDICFREGYDNVASKYSPDLLSTQIVVFVLGVEAMGGRTAADTN